MNLPSWREWLFSAKAMLAALLALYIALTIPLENPYWAMATVYVVSHPLSGATRSKGLFRALGTLLGASVAVLMLPLFVNQPLVLCVVMALWVAFALYLSLLDRTPRSYIFMLSAYTVPLIMLGQVEHPDTVFEVALARSEEILLGIVCASLVNAVVFPSRIAPALGAKMDLMLNDARHWCGRLLNTRQPLQSDHQALQKLLLEVLALDTMILHLSYDDASKLPARHAREFRARMAMLAPQLISLADPLHQLHRELAVQIPELVQLIDELSRWIQGENPAADAQLLRERSRHLQAWLTDRYPAQSLLISSALSQIRQLIDLWQDALTLRQSFVAGPAQHKPALRYKVRQLIGKPLHYDYGLSAFSAISVGLSVLVASLIWIASGWAYGNTGIFMVAVVGCFFAAQDNPTPFIKDFLIWTVLSSVFAGFYLFVLLPNIHDFGSLAIVLAVPLLVLGSFGGRPHLAPMVVLLAVQTLSNMILRESYHANFPVFADISLSTILGVIFGLGWACITKPFGVEWAARRLAQSGWRDLANLTVATREQDPNLVAAHMIDRIGQLLPRLGLMRDQQLVLTDVTRDLRICFRLLELRHAGLPPAAKQRLQPLLNALHDYFLACAKARRQLPLDASLQQLLDNLLSGDLTTASALELNKAQALTGLRLALFPQHEPATDSLLPTGRIAAAGTAT